LKVFKAALDIAAGTATPTAIHLVDTSSIRIRAGVNADRITKLH